MIKLGHMGFNSILSFPIATFITTEIGLKHALIFMLGTLLVASLPDGDNFLNEQTDNGRLSFLPFVVTHRGATHTLYFSVIIGLLTFSLFILLNTGLLTSAIIGSSIFFGTFFHVLGDSFTPMGINVLPPLTDNFSLNMFNYNNFIANVLMYIIGMFSILMVTVIGIFEVNLIFIFLVAGLIFVSTYISVKKAEESDKRI